MIDVRHAQITNSLPWILAKQPWVEAISFATAQAFRKMLDYADRTRTYSDVDHLPDEVLDAMAVDLHVLHYDRNFSIDIKRRLIKFALQYWSTAGTVSATEQVARIIFGAADISEWYEYNGTPGCFKISINNNMLTDEDVVRFKEAAEQNKRLSAWLDYVELKFPPKEMTTYVGFFPQDAKTVELVHGREPNRYGGFFVCDYVNEIHKMEVD